MAKYLLLSLLFLSQFTFAQSLSFSCNSIGADKGSRFDLTINAGTIQISNNTTDLNAGTYRYLRPLTARDGSRYFVYDLSSEGNESFSLLLDSTLVQKSSGLAKLRESGEDFSEIRFACKAQ